MRIIFFLCTFFFTYPALAKVPVSYIVNPSSNVTPAALPGEDWNGPVHLRNKTQISPATYTELSGKMYDQIAMDVAQDQCAKSVLKAFEALPKNPKFKTICRGNVLSYRGEINVSSDYNGHGLHLQTAGIYVGCGSPFAQKFFASLGGPNEICSATSLSDRTKRVNTELQSAYDIWSLTAKKRKNPSGKATEINATVRNTKVKELPVSTPKGATENGKTADQAI